MAAPDKVITNGTGPVLHDWSFKSTVSGPDEITFTAQNCPARTTYAKGDQVSGYTAMRIVDTMAKLVPGSQYDIQCQARGLISGSSRVTKRSNSTDPFGFDVINETRMELKTQTVPTFGAAHDTEANCRFMSAGEEEHLDIGDGTSAWVTRTRVYKGIMGASYKLVQRKQTTNGNIVSGDFIVPWPGGWDDIRGSQVSLPRLVVSDTIISTIGPQSTAFPGTETPVNAPAVLSLNVTGIGGTVHWNWPSGWVITGQSGQELYRGAGLWSVTVDYEFVYTKQLG